MTEPSFSESEKIPLSQLRSGMVAHHLNDAAKFAEQYIHFIQATCEGAKPSGKEYSSLIQLKQDTAKCTRDCFTGDTQDDAPLPDKDYVALGYAVRQAPKRFKGLLACMNFVLDIAKRDLAATPLTEEQRAQFPLLEAQNAEAMAKTIKLTQLYCGYSQMFQDSKTLSPHADPDVHPFAKSGTKMNDGIWMILKSHKPSIFQTLREEILKEHSQQFSVSTFSPYSNAWKAGSEIAKQELAAVADAPSQTIQDPTSKGAAAPPSKGEERS